MLITERVGIANVTFEPGCRNNWHIHHKGRQILLCTAGRGYYQEWGKPAQEMKPGDVINIPPEVKHWHGAAWAILPGPHILLQSLYFPKTIFIGRT